MRRTSAQPFSTCFTARGLAYPPLDGGGGQCALLPLDFPLIAPPRSSPLTDSPTECREPASCPTSPVARVRRARCVRPPYVPSTHTMTLRPSSVFQLDALPLPPLSSLPDVPDPVSAFALGARLTVTRCLATLVTYPTFRTAVCSPLVAELTDFANTYRLDYLASLSRVARTIPLTQPHMVQQVLLRFGLLFSSAPPTPLPTGHTLSAPPSDESVEPSGPYLELVGCLMYLMTCTRLNLAYSLSIWRASLRRGDTALSTDGLLRGCEAEIYTGAMAAQELRGLAYLLTILGEQPRSATVRYADNKAMIALCHEQRLESRTKHIALRYFLVRELQQRGLLRLFLCGLRGQHC
ncbi:unnamed protein product [Closterium sp. NIES-53]